MIGVLEWSLDAGDMDATFVLVLAWVVVAVAVAVWYLTRGGDG